MASDHSPRLVIDGLSTGYDALPVVHGVTFSVGAGELVTLVGPNGAGKSTLLRAMSGILPAWAGHVELDGRDVTGRPAHELVSHGLTHVAEGHRVLREMTVDENLRLAMWGIDDRDDEASRRQEVFQLFPVLKDRLWHRAGVLSGGEQQMLVIGQALVKRPRILLLDEPSLGLAPRLIDQVFGVVRQLHGHGMTIVLVEQVVDQALDMADRALVLHRGRVIADGSPEQVRSGRHLEAAFRGMS